MKKDEQARKKIGRRIADLRKSSGLTQSELSERAGVGQDYIARLEAGRYGASIDILSRIAKAFNLEIDFI